MAKRQKQWIYSPRKAAPSLIPESMKMEVTSKANELIETVLKPKHIQPPPENPRFNYTIDLYGKWYRSYFYFCSTYGLSQSKWSLTYLRGKVHSSRICRQ